MAALAALIASVLLFATAVFADEPVAAGRESTESPAAALLRRALLAELDGDDTSRAELLTQARLLDPDFAPARWHSGQIESDGAWKSIDELMNDPDHRQKVESYRQLRSQLSGSSADHVALAEWCRRSGLPEQERLHWLAVLQRDPQHELARKRLKLVEFRGMLLTPDEVESYKEFLKWQDEKEREWEPRAKRWRDALTGGNPALREQAEKDLRDVKDLGAIPFLEGIVAPASEEAGQQVVEVLTRFDHQVATNGLLRLAVFSPFAGVRQSATEELSKRSLYAFMPALVGSLSKPIELSYFVDAWSGKVTYGYSALQEGPESVLVSTSLRGSQIFFETSGIPDIVELITERHQFTLLGAREGIAEGARLKTQVARANAAAEELNQRIYPVLEYVTNQQLQRRPEDWWQWWRDYNEIEQSSQKPVFHSQSAQYSSLVSQTRRAGGQGGDCFLPGTLVPTDTGDMPIESIRIGDRVLAQDPVTGEMSFKLVVNATVRETSPTLRVGLGDEEIVTTPGHPMWVVGKGWQMAKQLSVGDRLHGALGARTIRFIERGPESHAHSLVVADFHTYMIGKHRILVHDNMLRRPTANRIPGWAE